MFYKRIPEQVLDNTNAKQFVQVLDGVQEFKTEELNKSLRVYNPILSTSIKWHLKFLEEFGIDGIPDEIPLRYLMMFSLNINTILSLIGSRLGIEAFCSIFTLGEVSIDDSGAYVEPTMIVLDSKTEGFIVDSTDDSKLHICTSTEDFTKQGEVIITIKSPVFNTPDSRTATIMYDYIVRFLKTYVPLLNTIVTIKVSGRSEDYFHNLINPYINGKY